MGSMWVIPKEACYAKFFVGIKLIEDLALLLAFSICKC